MRWLHRAGWFGLLWVVGVAAVSALAFVIRAAIL